MKKIITLILALVMVTCVFAACGATGNTGNNGDNGDNGDNGGNVDNGGASVELPWNTTEELANMILAAIPEDKIGPVGPMAIDLSAEGANYELTELGLPAELHGKIDSATKIVHMMMLNQFSAGIYHFATADEASASVETIKNAILSKEWMCGFPEKVMIITLPDNYVISVFGLGGLDPDPNFAVDYLTPFADAAKSLVEGVKVVVDEPIL